MDNIKIQKMSINDIDDVLKVEASHNISILTKNMLLNDLNNNNTYYLVAKKSDKIVGYIGISYILDTADIISIVVDKNYTKQKIASNLIQNILDFCNKNNITKIMLEVRASNIPAQNLYYKFGFKKISERKNYYNGEDAYIMEKTE